ncbi:hypothetical protein, partial [Neobacillus vireti]|uniref:hypothetical protein n=1 Tax=Neobacillus vireti TaxID=220686 RepID=UPI0019554B4A
RRGGSPARPRKAKPPGVEINRQFRHTINIQGTFSVPSFNVIHIFNVLCYYDAPKIWFTII